ncbi:autotransporter outer membrane beta-barrel domain-containing protein [Wielerella bovis]|uniref:autotransporter outer membrane beta-barrel domain-containing protein n=1 Tax=Wielerella bovis TaxID=2917790 RepID=UPI002019C9BE|nr:autotransporter outer membrane beta-barrel domain-containing protein [Wielerella bovis]ULJ68554.1 autotransporter outer membrane beta-barrel domain-containing protein [Wielerella bovis]
MMKHNALKPVVVAIAAALCVPTVSAEDVVCQSASGCRLSNLSSGSNVPTHWIFSENGATQNLNDNQVNMTLLPQTYQNGPATETGVTVRVDPVTGKTQYEYHIDSLISITGSDDNLNANLIILTGSNIILENARDGSHAIDLSKLFGSNNVLKANIEQGATITINPNYAQQTGATHPETGETWEAGRAIHADGNHVLVNTSANIVLNGDGAFGIDSAGGATVYASNHSISLNKDWGTGALIYNKALVQLDNVSMTGQRNLTVGIDLADDTGANNYNRAQSTAIINNSTISLSGTHLTAGIVQGGGLIELNDSRVEAAYGVASFNDDIDLDSNSMLNIRNSQVLGKKGLFVANPQEWRDILANIGETVDVMPKDFIIHADNSTLTGATILDSDLRQAGTPYGALSLNLSNQSVWQMQNNSEIDSLKVDNSIVKLGHANAGQFNRLTINQALSGSGTFELNADYANATSDQIVVKGTSAGSHTLNIRNTTNTVPSSTNSFTVVDVENNGAQNDATFALGSGSTVNIGAYKYALAKQGNDWVMASTTNNANTPTPPATNTGGGTVTPNNPTPPIHNPSASVNQNFSDALNNRIAHSIAAAQLLQQQQGSLNIRQHELHQQQRLNGLWLQGEHGVMKRDGEYIRSTQSGYATAFKQKTTGWQVGYDHAIGQHYVGILAGKSHSTVDYQDPNPTVHYADSDLDSNTFAIYGGTQWGDWFADGTLRHTRYKASGDFAHDRFRINSLNAQIGRNIALKNQWKLVPQASLTVGKLSGSNYIEDATLLQSRLGADVRGNYTLGNGIGIEPIFGAYYVGDHRNATVVLNNLRYTSAKVGHRIAGKAGVNVKLSPNQKFSMNVQTEHGSRTRRPYWLDVGYSFTW